MEKKIARIRRVYGLGHIDHKELIVANVEKVRARNILLSIEKEVKVLDDEIEL